MRGSAPVSDGPTRRHWGRSRTRQSVVILLLTTLLGAAVVGAGSTLTGPRYTSASQILWDPAALQYLGDDAVPNNPEVLDRAVTDQREVIFSDPVVGAAAQELGMDEEDLREAVTVDVQAGSSLLVVSASADQPQAAEDIATQLTAAYVENVRVSGANALRQQADLLQPTIDRLAAERAALDADLVAVSGELAGTPVTTPVYGVLQGRVDRLATRIGDITALEAEYVSRQETLRATAESFPGQAFVIRQPEVPEAPSSLSLTTALVLGAGVGLFIGACIVFFLFGRSRQSTSDERSGQPTG